jgi:hypothetical protein
MTYESKKGPKKKEVVKANQFGNLLHKFSILLQAMVQNNSHILSSFAISLPFIQMVCGA